MNEKDIVTARAAYAHVFEVLLAASLAEKAANEEKAASAAATAKAKDVFEETAAAARTASDAKIAIARAVYKKVMEADEEVTHVQDAAIAAAKANLAAERAEFEAQYGPGFFPGAPTGGARTRI